MAKKKYYAVLRGRKPGIYSSWYGRDGAEIQVKGYPEATYKGFSKRSDAVAYLKEDSPEGTAHLNDHPIGPPFTGDKKDRKKSEKGSQTVIYTDGGCLSNPGPGGWGVVIIHRNRREEFSGGFRLTTNNRMELTACIEGLKALDTGTSATIYSDSIYVVNGISKGWAEKWRSNNWMRNTTDKALNADLWELLLKLCETRAVAFKWVKGHAGNLENERCDRLAGRAAMQENLPEDPGYDTG